MDETELKRAYKIALRNCTWHDIKLLFKIIHERNVMHEQILKDLIREKRKNETA